MEEAAGRWFPSVTAGVLLRLGDFRVGRVVLEVATTHFVEHQVQRRYDIEAEAARAGLPEGVAWGTGDVAVGVVLELEAKRSMRVVGEHLVAEGDVLRGDDLLACPLAAACEAVGKAHGIGGMKRGAARAIGVGHQKVAALEAVVPRTPALRLGEARVNVLPKLHARDAAQDHRGDMWGGRRVRIPLARIAPERCSQR